MRNKLINWIIASGLSMPLDPESANAKMPGANTYQIYKSLNKGDIESVNSALNSQLEYEKAVAPNKAKVAATTLGYFIPGLRQAMPWIILGAEDIADIYGKGTKGDAYKYPTSYAGYKEIMNDPSSSLKTKLDATTNYGITWAGLLSALKPAGKYIFGNGVKEGMKRAGKMFGLGAATSTIPFGTGVLLYNSGMYDKHPGLSEAIFQASQYSTMLLPSIMNAYTKGINKVAQKTHMYKPTVKDTSGKVVVQPTHTYKETSPGQYKYVGESYNGSKTRKNILTRLGADPIIQDNSKMIIQSLDGQTGIYDAITGSKTILPAFSTPLQLNLLQ